MPCSSLAQTSTWSPGRTPQTLTHFWSSHHNSYANNDNIKQGLMMAHRLIKPNMTVGAPCDGALSPLSLKMTCEGRQLVAAGGHRRPTATWWFQLRDAFKPWALHPFLAPSGTPISALFIQLQTCPPSVSKHLSCHQLWAVRLIGGWCCTSLAASLHYLPFSPSLSWAVRWLILVLGGIRRQMLSHSSCRSGSECWVHLHSEAQRCPSFFFLSSVVSCLTQISFVSLSSSRLRFHLPKDSDEGKKNSWWWITVQLEIVFAFWRRTLFLADALQWFEVNKQYWLDLFQEETHYALLWRCTVISTAHVSGSLLKYLDQYWVLSGAVTRRSSQPEGIVEMLLSLSPETADST